MTDSPPLEVDLGTCKHYWGDHSYTLEYVSGGLSADDQTSLLSSYSIVTSGVNGELVALAGAINSLDYLGTHEIKIVGKNADKYNSIDVAIFEITYVNPCLTTTINIPSIPAMRNSVFSLKTVSQTFDAFTDAVSSNNGGDGYNYCETRTHYIRMPDGSVPDFMTENALTLTVDSTNNDDVGQYQVYLWCKLDKYPDISDYAIVTVTIDPCDMLSWKATQ